MEVLPNFKEKKNPSRPHSIHLQLIKATLQTECKSLKISRSALEGTHFLNIFSVCVFLLRTQRKLLAYFERFNDHFMNIYCHARSYTCAWVCSQRIAGSQERTEMKWICKRYVCTNTTVRRFHTMSNKLINSSIKTSKWTDFSLEGSYMNCYRVLFRILLKFSTAVLWSRKPSDLWLKSRQTMSKALSPMATP